MAAPVVHAHTRAVYESLPEVYVEADVDDGGAAGKPLLRFLSLVLDQAGAVVDVLDRIDPEDGGSELLSAQLADAAWLPWLAMMRGVASLPDSLSEAEKRNAVEGAVSGWQAGTRSTIAAAALTALTDPEGYVSVRAHSGGDPYVIGVSVDPEFAPADLQDVIDAIEKARARPAGIKLVIDLYAATWATLEAKLPTWTAVETRGPWNRIEGTDP